MNVREKKTENHFEELGFLVHTVTKPSRPGLNHDIFGLWDHIVIVPKNVPLGFRQGDVIFVQTKSRKQYGKDLIKYQEFPAKYKYIFCWIKNKSNRYELTIQEIK